MTFPNVPFLVFVEYVSLSFMFNQSPAIVAYFSNPEETTSTLDSEGWLKTGDLCYIDDDGFIFVVDRLKELIKYKGYQVNETPLPYPN